MVKLPNGDSGGFAAAVGAASAAAAAAAAQNSGLLRNGMGGPAPPWADRTISMSSGMQALYAESWKFLCPNMTPARDPKQVIC